MERHVMMFITQQSTAFTQISKHDRIIITLIAPFEKYQIISQQFVIIRVFVFVMIGVSCNVWYL